jgi:transposase InsO family protein
VADILQPWQVLLAVLAGWVNRHQQAAIDYRGYRHIEGALANLGHRAARTTVASILKRHGLNPAPERGRRTPWRTFLGAHWTTIAAIDFTGVEVWCKHGLVTFYVLFVLELSTRRVHRAGVTPGPDERWMMQIGRNLTDGFDGFLQDKRFVIMDRDGKYTDAFRALLSRAGVQVVRLPARSPNLNAWIERFVRSVKEECLDRMIFFGEASLRRAVREFIAHYHAERNHQGLGNRIIQPEKQSARASGPVRCRERLGGMLRYYYRDAAQARHLGVCVDDSIRHESLRFGDTRTAISKVPTRRSVQTSVHLRESNVPGYPVAALLHRASFWTIRDS